MSDQNIKDDDYWKDKLSSDEYYVCREKGTERAFTGEYWDCKAKGQYICRCCSEALFDSSTKYDSGSGWPSFYAPANSHSVDEVEDNTLGMRRVEVVCSKCGSHLGHVFPDGPAPTGMRYCINSLSVKLQEQTE